MHISERFNPTFLACRRAHFVNAGRTEITLYNNCKRDNEMAKIC